MLLSAERKHREVLDLISDDESSRAAHHRAALGESGMFAAREQTMRLRRQMRAAGLLLSREELRAQLGVTYRRVQRLIAEYSISSVELDGEDVYPSIFCDEKLNLTRLYRIASILAPAYPEARLDFLTAPCGALGGRVPLELLAEDGDYRELRRFAKDWASEYSRTSVSFYAGAYDEAVPGSIPLFVSIAEVDPRGQIWKRALAALTCPGHRKPQLAPQAPPVFFAIIERQTFGRSGSELEAVVQCQLSEAAARVHIERVGARTPETLTLELRSTSTTVSDVGKDVLTALTA
ncbi:conserved hypothetical protein [Burkholderia sp. 8Y]|nr:conserved hypothetical protein [Burkholderia sp. 8Y]